MWSMRGQLYFRWAEHCERTGRDPLPSYDEAEKSIVEGCRLMPNMYPSWRERGHMRLKRGQFRRGQGDDPAADFEDAERSLAVALELTPHASDAYDLRGRVRLERGMLKEKTDRAAAEALYKGAIEDFENAVRYDPAFRAPLAQPLEDARSRLQSLRP